MPSSAQKALILSAFTLLFAQSLTAQEIPVLLADPLESTLQTTPNSMNQVTSVSELSDVQPTDWAFRALQSLVERYGVASGYPDRTFRGNRAMTRYEFAAGLSRTLDRMDETLKATVGQYATAASRICPRASDRQR
jgi:S-layer homology domain